MNSIHDITNSGLNSKTASQSHTHVYQVLYFLEPARETALFCLSVPARVIDSAVTESSLKSALVIGSIHLADRRSLANQQLQALLSDNRASFS